MQYGGVSPDHFIRPTPKLQETYPDDDVDLPQNGCRPTLIMNWIYTKTDADLPQNETSPIHQLSQSERSGGWYSGMRAFFCEQTGMPEPRSERKRTQKPRNERCRIKSGMTETQRAMPDQGQHDGSTKRA